MPQSPTYIVTGGAGFVGANVVATLLARSPRPRVLVIDTFRTGTFRNLVDACDRLGSGPFDGEVMAVSTADVDWESLLEQRRPAGVIHEAAITDTTLADEAEMLRENVDAFLPILHSCIRADVPLAYASSAATYGTPAQARDRVSFPLEAAGRPDNVYGFSKWVMEAEHRRAALAEGRDVRVVGLRYFNVFGPCEAAKGRMASMVHQLARQLLDGKRPRLFREGEQARDQVYVDDVVGCTLAAAAVPGFGSGRPRPGVYNVGSGVATTFNQLLAALRGALDIPESQRPTDFFDMPPDIRRFYQDWTCADLSANESGLGWRPGWKPADAIADYARWLKAR